MVEKGLVQKLQYKNKVKVEIRCIYNQSHPSEEGHGCQKNWFSLSIPLTRGTRSSKDLHVSSDGNTWSNYLSQETGPINLTKVDDTWTSDKLLK